MVTEKTSQPPAMFTGVVLFVYGQHCRTLMKKMPTHRPLCRGCVRKFDISSWCSDRKEDTYFSAWLPIKLLP